jgi:hypothetical protein
MVSLKKITPSNAVLTTFRSGILLGLILILLGWILIPTTSFLSLAATCLILVVYSLVSYFVFPRVPPEMLRFVVIVGLLAGIIFAGEILLEYALLPSDNTRWGLLEFGGVFALYFLSGFWVAYRHKSIKAGNLAAIMTAMLSSVIWLIFLLLTFYLFRGTSRQEVVFAAEGTFADFAASGMSDFNTFVMEDLLGAGFFHLLLAPFLAAILGTIGSVLGKGMIRLRKH